MKTSGILLAMLFVLSCNKKPRLVGYESSECEENIFNPNLKKYNNRIIKANFIDNELVVEVFVVTNCNKTFEGEIELEKDTLNLIFHGKQEVVLEGNEKVIVEELVDCDCAFNLTYRVENLKEGNYLFEINGNPIEKLKDEFKVIRNKPKYDLIESDTINYIDIYGLKQGVHICYRKDGKLYSKIDYKNDQKINGLSSAHYDFLGYDVVKTFMKNSKYSKREYYIDNMLVKTCDTDGSFNEGTNCVGVN